MSNNVVLIKDDKGGYRVKVSYLYNNDPHVVFSPESSKLNQALMMTKRVIHQLKKRTTGSIPQRNRQKN